MVWWYKQTKVPWTIHNVSSKHVLDFEKFLIQQGIHSFLSIKTFISECDTP